MNNIKNKISQNKILTFVVVAFVLALSLYGCKTFIANAANNQEEKSTENQGQVDVNNEQAVNDEAPLEAYGYKDTTSEVGQTILVLTYDKDKEEHRDAGQKVYNVPTAATQQEDWEWTSGDVQNQFTKIKINSNFKDYDGITSTSHMFVCLHNVASYEGLGNLNLSNVTDTSQMFSLASKDHTFECLDLSEWDTSNVKNCTFMLYSLKVSSIKVGPKFNLSLWDCCLTNSKGKNYCVTWHDADGNVFPDSSIPTTRDKVTTYYDHQILCAYGYKDANKLILTYDREMYNHKNQGQKVFDIRDEKAKSPWYWEYYKDEITEVTIKDDFKNFHGLTSTAHMFQDLFYVNKVEGFENIDTSNVTSMMQMFSNFGCRSTSLNTVPDVSNWDTSNVTDMSWMFHHYGGDSDALDKTPNVSKWDTRKLTKTTSMFEDYGKGSFENIDFSNWDTSNITDRANYDHMLDCLKLGSITLGTKWDLETSCKTHFENSAWLTDSERFYMADWYDINGKGSKTGHIGKIIRTEPTTYYDAKHRKHFSQFDLKSSDVNSTQNVKTIDNNVVNKKAVAFDLKSNQQHAIDNAISQHSQNSSLIHHITHHVSKVAEVVKKVFH